MNRIEELGTPLLRCVEIGGSGTQTLLLGRDVAGAVDPVVVDPDHDDPADAAGGPLGEGATVLIAVPGLVGDGRVVAASNLGWFDVDPAEQLGLPTAALVLNDAHAQALGESALHGVDDLTYLALGTGVGGAVVSGGAVVADNLFGHTGAFSDDTCVCGRTGCLETIAAGWAAAPSLDDASIEAIAEALAVAVRDEPLAMPHVVVVGGGMARSHPSIVARLAAYLPDRDVRPSAAPPLAKSAAAWGLRRAASLAGLIGMT